MSVDDLKELDLPESGDAFASAATDDRLVLSMPSRNGLFRTLTAELGKRLPADLGEHHGRGMFNIYKVHFLNERVHYEVGLDVNRRLLEIGLHFEDGPFSTVQYLSYFDQRIVEIKETLGWQADLERWTQSWGRLYELHPLQGLDKATTQLAVDRLVAYITTLQPLVEAAGVPPERSADPVKSRRSRWK